MESIHFFTDGEEHGYSYMLVNSWEDRTSSIYIHSTYTRKALLRENNPIHQKDRLKAFLMITFLVVEKIIAN